MTTAPPVMGVSDIASARTRSFGGCATCRSRHVKCDEAKPTCSRCAYFGLVCAGYTKNVIFATEDDDGAVEYRRPLFSDSEREHMSELLRKAVAPQNALALIAEIDDQCSNGPRETESQISIYRGPFGAFKWSRPIPSREANSDIGSPLEHTFAPCDDLLDSYSLQLSPWTEGLLTFPLTNSEQSGIMPLLDLQHTFNSQNSASELSGGIPFVESQSLPIAPYVIRDDLSDTMLTHPILQPITSNPYSPASVIPQDAISLLKHYADNVVPSLTPFKHMKTPWHVLFLPNAKSTLAGLAMGEAQDDAGLAVFYGILSVSALHRHISSAGQKWYVQASFYKSKAQKHTNNMLRRAHDKPKPFKYKTVVMALVTMIQISIADGTCYETESYFLEAEKFIRLRGLIKSRKSRKVRLLHHCYTYMRIFHESLSLLSTRSDQCYIVQLAVEQSGVVVKEQDNLSFRVASWDNLDEKMLEIKSRDSGENDLHLSHPGLWSSTLYPEIFGVPESWLNLLSQVIRLGNDKDLSENWDEIGYLSLKEFSSRAKALERCILRWRCHPHNVIGQIVSKDHSQIKDVDWKKLGIMLAALHEALAIYFYRRIYDVDSTTLQPKVVQVRDCLLACEPKDPCAGTYFTGLAWPALIAVCEAVDPELQKSFSAWLEVCARQSGQSFFYNMQQLIKQVWRERLQSNKTSISWPELLRNNKIRL